MANNKGYTFTKEELAKIKNSESKMTGKQKQAVSKALVIANTEANNPRKRRKV